MSAQHGLVERLRNGGQPDLADMAAGLLSSLQHMVRWHDQLTPAEISRANAAITAATGSWPTQAEVYGATIDKDLEYVEITLDDLDADVLVGLTYTAGDPGCHTMSNGDPGWPAEPEEVEISEVWINGVDIAPVILERCAEQLTASARDKVLELKAEQRDNDAADRAEARHRDRMEAL